ncbi:hypothetical protein CSC52_1294 [Staphylococcus aureus]|nr:hypothetical protein CSC52_1294 [Staphylococcus aureus]
MRKPPFTAEPNRYTPTIELPNKSFTILMFESLDLVFSVNQIAHDSPR